MSHMPGCFAQQCVLAGVAGLDRLNMQKQEARQSGFIWLEHMRISLCVTVLFC